jgi:O-succinylbenzoate synthase
VGLVTSAALVAHPVRVPLRAALAGARCRDVILLHGPAGWGEYSPLPGYPCDPAACRRGAEDSALAADRWPASVRTVVPVNALIPAVGPDEAARLAVEAGGSSFKIKVGDDGDVDRVAAVRSAVGRSARLRVDANGAWTVDEAVAAIARLAVYDLELVEEPVARLEDLARVRRRVAVPVAADECIRTLDDARRLAALSAADALVVKVQPLGGLPATLDIIAAAGVPAIVSSLYETSVGLGAGLALAACLPELPYACGLGTATLLAADVVAEPLVPVDGLLAVRRPEPDPALIAALASKEAVDEFS